MRPHTLVHMRPYYTTIYTATHYYICVLTVLKLYMGRVGSACLKEGYQHYTCAGIDVDIERERARARKRERGVSSI